MFKAKHDQTVITEAEIVFVNTSGNADVVYQTYKIADFIILGTELTSEGYQDLIVDIYFNKFEVLRDNSIGSPTSYGWDFFNNVSWSAPF